MQFIFDFDGVLCNSLDEVAITARNALDGERRRSCEALDECYLSRFRTHRYLVGPAGDFILFARWCIASAEDSLSTERWQEIRRTEHDSLKSRTELFFESRSRFMDECPEEWLALHTPYSRIFQAVQNYAESNQVLIVTNKNRRPVETLLSSFGLPVQRCAIFSGDAGETKRSNLEQVFSRFPAERYLFIEDSLSNLRELRDIACIQGVLATWGYVGHHEVAEAEVAGFTLGTEESVSELLQPFC